MFPLVGQQVIFGLVGNRHVDSLHGYDIVICYIYVTLHNSDHVLLERLIYDTRYVDIGVIIPHLPITPTEQSRPVETVES